MFDYDKPKLKKELDSLTDNLTIFLEENKKLQNISSNIDTNINSNFVISHILNYYSHIMVQYKELLNKLNSKNRSTVLNDLKKTDWYRFRYHKVSSIVSPHHIFY